MSITVAEIEPLATPPTETPATGLAHFHVTLCVSDLDRSVRFYERLFDRQPALYHGKYARFDLDRPALVLVLVATSRPPGGAQPCRPPSSAHRGTCRDSAAPGSRWHRHAMPGRGRVLLRPADKVLGHRSRRGSGNCTIWSTIPSIPASTIRRSPSKKRRRNRLGFIASPTRSPIACRMTTPLWTKSASKGHSTCRWTTPTVRPSSRT